jgi:hypothetical protein
MIHEFEQAALTVDVSEFGFQAGDVGTVVDITPNGKQVTLEFFNFAGKMIAIVPVSINQVRALGENEVLHTRKTALQA